MLESLGVEPDVELVYRTLLGRPGTTAAGLAEVSERPLADVERALATLVGSGLVLRSDEGLYVAAPPSVALGALITERRDGLRLAEQALAGLAEEHRAATAGRSISALIEVVTGVDAIRHRYQQVQQAATTELRSFVTAPFVAVPPGQNAAEPAAATRGVRNRAVLETAVLSEDGATEEAVDSLQRGLELRVVEKLPLKLVLADADLALVPLVVDPDGPMREPGAVLLQRSGLLAALDALFERVWQQAYPLDVATAAAGGPLGGEEPEGPTQLDRQVLGLMLAGLSDQAVAGQLDLSLRTVQRRLRDLQDRAGVNTRMQLGWYAARNGWA
jgi:DNA-binding CsgD family transcriptional regulator/sugar-specific transcriptional regulator TrmB